MAAHLYDEALRDGTRATDCHHIVTRRLKEGDAAWNFLALSRETHRQYEKSWKAFIEKYRHLKEKVLAARARMHRRTE